MISYINYKSIESCLVATVFAIAIAIAFEVIPRTPVKFWVFGAEKISICTPHKGYTIQESLCSLKRFFHLTHNFHNFPNQWVNVDGF